MTLPRLRSFVIPAVPALLLIFACGCPLLTPAGRPVGDIALQRIADGFTSPLALVEPPDRSGRLFIVDQVGLIHVLDASGDRLPAPFLDLRSRIVQLSPTYDERGLLGLALHPDYAANGRLFVFYVAPKGADAPAEFDSEIHVSEFRVSSDPNAADPDSERLILRIFKPQANHNGGQLAFGDDGFLYISVGDGGGANDTDIGHTPGIGNGQDKAALLGKILRIDIDAGDPYAVPADNPFAGDPAAAPEVWVFGLRNPWRFSFDPPTGRLFVADAGQNLIEEVSIAPRGGNMGWRIREGSTCFNADNPDSPLAGCPATGAGGEPLIGPIVEYRHTDDAGRPIGTAVIGGFVYRGSAIPELTGQYIFGDFGTNPLLADGRLFAATEGAGGVWSHGELLVSGSPTGRLGQFVLGFGQDAAGELYVLATSNLGPVGETGAVYRIEPP